MSTDSTGSAGRKSGKLNPGGQTLAKDDVPDTNHNSGSSQRRVTEKAVFREMTLLFCRAQHRHDTICPECDALVRYAWQRIDACRFGDAKSFCSACTVHCFSPDRRAQTKLVMRFAGPRMLFHRPLMFIRHMIKAKG